MTDQVVILGASPKSERYANRAQSLLKLKGFAAVPVNPAYDEIDGVKCFKRIEEVEPSGLDITCYLGPARLNEILGAVIAFKPARFIFNPGTENEAARKRLEEAGVHIVEACTLVLLTTGTFAKA